MTQDGRHAVESEGGEGAPDYHAAAVAASNDAVLGVSADGTVVRWNAGAESIFGYKAAEIIGKQTSILVPAERAAEHQEFTDRVRRGERIDAMETVRLTREGRSIEVLLWSLPLRDETGRVVGSARIMRDITDQKRSEQALRDSETRHRAILDASLDGIITIDERGIIESINPAGQRLFGYTAGEVVGKNVSMLMPQPYQREHDTYLANYKRTRQPRIIGIGREVVGLRKDGTTFPMELAVSELNLSGRRVFTGTVHDITERKQAEHAMQESARRFRMIADALPQMMWTTGADARVDYCNARWVQYTGLTLDQTISGGIVQAIHPDEAREVEAQWKNAIARGESYSTECRFRRASDGAYRWFLVRGVSVGNPGGGVVQWIGTCTDIEEQKRALQVEAARMEAESANRAKSEFLANMSHEIRTPMAAILGYADLLLDPEYTASDRHNAVNVIRRNGAHLLNVINDILDLSKIEAGELKVDIVPCSPSEVLAEVTSLTRVRAKEAGLKFHLKIEGMIPETVQTDPTRLRQILINLAGNAVKFTEEGWVRLVAKLIDPPDSPNPRMRYEVIDTGIGMTQEQIKQLFKPFMQVDSSLTRRFGGTGLGLTISQRLAKALGGEITVDSMPGRGSLFALTLPTGSLKGVKLTQDVTEALGGTAPTEARPATGSAIRLKGHILLAEDGPDNRQLLSAYLEKAGAKVTVAENGRIAYEKVVETMHEGEGGYDLVLMDMQMPELDGYGATAKLRSVGFQKPIVALTANAMSTDRAKCVRAGCTDYLSKPVKRDDLLKTVQRYLQAGEAAASAEASERAAVEAAPKESPKDDLLSKFRPEYVAKLPQEVTRLVTYAVSGRYEDLDQVAHNLAGTAGMFGFMDISKSAAALMKDLKADAGRETIELGVQGLVELIRQVPGYDRSKEDKG